MGWLIIAAVIAGCVIGAIGMFMYVMNELVNSWKG